MKNLLQVILVRLRSLRSAVGIAGIGTWLILGSLIGVVAGTGAVLFTFGIDVCTQFFFGTIAGYKFPGLASEPTRYLPLNDVTRQWLFFFIPAVGGLISGFLVYTFAPEAEGHGTDEAVRAFHQGRGIIRKQVPLIKGLASMLTIGSGGSAGREGPVAQIGAGFGSYLAGVLKLPDKDRRLMVLAGMGGGIGSIFRAPLGGALFATEVLYREPDFEYEGIIPAIISAIVAYSIYGFVYGWGAIFDTPKLLFHQPLHLVFYLVFGLVAAGFGVLYVRVFYGMRDHVFRKIRIKKHFRPAIGGLMLGVLGYFYPPVLGGGYGWIQLAIYGQLALGMMIIFPVLKIIATSLTISSGGSGGVFAPSLVIGGMLGGAFGQLCQMAFPGLEIQPAGFIMVGMAGFFAGIAKVPISALIMVAEMTGSYGLLVPTMLVAAISLLVTGRTTIYEQQVAHRAESPAHRGEFLMGVLETMKVREAMVPTESQQIVKDTTLLKDLLRLVSRTHHHYFLTVDEKKRLTGMVSLDDLRQVILDAHMGAILVAKDLAFPAPPAVGPDDSLGKALNVFVLNSLDELPVIASDSGKIVGLLRKKDLVVVYTQAIAGKKSSKAEQKTAPAGEPKA